MRLSEAIRLGAMLKPQGKVSLFRHGATCALGAALDAIGKIGDRTEDSEDDYDTLKLEFPILREVVPCFMGGTPRPMSDAIWGLNDNLRWTREQIADWVETIESARQPALTDAAHVDAVAAPTESATPVHSRF